MEQIKVFSMNIRCYDRSKLELIINKENPDIILFQEIRITKNTRPWTPENYYCVFSHLAYAGVMTLVRRDIKDRFIKNIEILIEGRLMLIEFNDGQKLFNVYHKRITNRNDIAPRIEYDRLFITEMIKFINDELILVGDFNSVHKFHDSVKNLSVMDDKSRKCPEKWVPGNSLDKNFGCYERHFLASFINLFNLIDNGINKGFTFKKFEKDCMRIDFLLSSSKIDSYEVKDMGEISDHKAIIFNLN